MSEGQETGNKTYAADRERYRQKRRKPRPVREDGGFKLSPELEELSDLIPGIGNGYRWYDWPYRFSRVLLSSWPRRVIPGAARAWISALSNWLYQFNVHDRNKAQRLDLLHDNLFVPEDEHVHRSGIWLVELFPPSELASLERALKKNGWNEHRPFSVFNEDNIGELARARSREGVFWWDVINLASRKNGGFNPYAIREELPADFEYIELKALQVGPSLTAVIAEFHLADNAATKLDREWHSLHEPIMVRSEGKVRTFNRLWASYHQVQTTRRDLHDTARTWLSRRLPGYFARNGAPSPLLELLLFDKYDPTVLPANYRSHTGRIKTSNALRALGISESHFEQFESPDLPKLVLSEAEPHLHRVIGDVPSWTLWGSRPAIVKALGEGGLGGYGGDVNRAIAGRLVDNMSNFFVMLAISEYLTITENRLAKIRDRASTNHGKFRSRALGQLRKSILTLSLNLTSTHRDVISFWSRPWRWEGDADFNAVLTPVEKSRRRKEKRELRPHGSVNKRLRERQEKWFDALIQIDRDHRDILSTVASLGASADSFKLGRVALWVALASLVVAVGTLLIVEIGPSSLLNALWTHLTGAGQ